MYNILPLKSPRVYLLFIFLLLLVLLLIHSEHTTRIYQHNLTAQRQLLEFSYQEQINLRKLENMFRSQLLDWKNILLRGREVDSYYQNLSNFYENERRVTKQLAELKSLMKHGDLFRNLVEQLISTHRQIGRKFRDGVRLFNRTDVKAHEITDKVYADLDKDFFVLLDTMNGAIQRYQEYKLQQQQQNINENLRKSTLISTSAAIILMILLYVIMDRKIKEVYAVQDELKRSRDTLDEAQAIAHVGSWEWNIVDGSLAWSDEIYRIFGLRPREFGATYEAFLERIVAEDVDKVTTAVNASLEDPEIPYDIEHRIQQPGGEVRYVREVGRIYRDTNGTPVRMIGTVNDITEIKRAQQELEKYQQHLEELVENRTAELHATQEELVKRERLSAMGELIATVSHELRNPLAVMKPSLYVVRKHLKNDDDRVQQAVERIERNIQRCDRLVDDLLDFTRVQILVQDSYNIDTWLKSVLEEQPVPADVELRQEYGLDNVRLFMDENRLHRAVINILKNAIQAVEKMTVRTPRITIATGRGLKNRIEIRIEDNGCGMSEEVTARIFEPLYSTKGFGVGLGMPTVRQIMQQHGGDIELESEPGKGTQVILWLPDSRTDTV